MDMKELTLAGMDLPDLMQRLMQNEALVPLFVRKFLADENYTQLTAAFAAGDMAGAQSASHTLKGMCGNLSITVLYELFTQQVKLLRAGDNAGAAQLMEEIVPAFENTIAHMKAWLAQQ